MDSSRPGTSLLSGFLKSAELYPDRPSVWTRGGFISYRELSDRASQVAAAIAAVADAQDRLVAVLGNRDANTYSAVLGTLAAGRAYLPLNPRYGAHYLQRILALSEANVLITDAEAAPMLATLLSASKRSLNVVLHEPVDPIPLRIDHPHHRFVMVGGDVDPTLAPSSTVRDDSLAYVMYTSGSTGLPKGVPISHGNSRGYVEHTADRMGIRETDRVSQAHDLSFDFSVHDLFTCWARGACLYIVPDNALMAPAKFIRDQELTVWASVPSVVGLMLKMRLLKPGAFPSLRRTIFCGEALPSAYAESWQQAAPNCVVENMYGPTEATVGITAYTWNSETSPADCRNGVVPIGHPFPNQQVVVVDHEGNEVPAGSPGELCLAGSQITSGYWKDDDETGRRFTVLPAHGSSTWYRTGDLAMKHNGRYHFLGRQDNQIKLRGYRVELQQIDWALRRASGSCEVISIAWPVNGDMAEGVVTFICNDVALPKSDILRACVDLLPDYMIPSRIVFIDKIPLNRNGKVDRMRLTKYLEDGA